MRHPGQGTESDRICDPPFFPGSSRSQQGALLEFTNAAADGLWIAVEKSRQVLEATPPQFENLGGSIKTAFPFTQGVKKLPHRGSLVEGE